MNYLRRLFTYLLFIILILSCDKTTTGSDPLLVTFPDMNFEQLIREALNKRTGDILDTELESITELTGIDLDIVNLNDVPFPYSDVNQIFPPFNVMIR